MVYDTADRLTSSTVENGATDLTTTVSVFDKLDRVTEIHHPAYTPPGGSELTPVESFCRI